MTSPSELPEPSRADGPDDAATAPGAPDATPAEGLRRRDIRSRHATSGAGEADTGEIPLLDGAAAAAGPEAVPQHGDTAAPPGSDDTTVAPAAAARRAPTSSRRRLLVVLGVVVAALVVVLVVLLVTRGGGERDPMQVVTVTLDPGAETPPVEPVERDTGTALLEALPDVVGGYAVTEQNESEAMLDAGALEGWSLLYTGAEGDVTVQVGQWPTEEEAVAAFDDLVADGGDATTEGDVVVDGDTVGGFVVQPVDGAGERTVWRNATAVFVAEGPAGTTQPFYETFPF